MKFVHDDVAHIGGGTFAKGDVGQNFRRATKDGRIAVDGGVASAEADVFRPKFPAERHEFLIDKRLDRAGVNRTASTRQRREMQGGGNKRFAGTGRRVENDVLLLEQFEDRRLLRRIEGEIPSLDVFKKL